MIRARQAKLRGRRLVVHDKRCLPARTISTAQAGRHFGHILNWVNRSGICVISSAGKPELILLDPAANSELTELIYATVAVAAARRHDPGGVFTLADEVFVTSDQADSWMASDIWSLAGKRPVDKLTTDQGIKDVLHVLNAILYGLSA